MKQALLVADSFKASHRMRMTTAVWPWRLNQICRCLPLQISTSILLTFDENFFIMCRFSVLKNYLIARDWHWRKPEVMTSLQPAIAFFCVFTYVHVEQI